ncbi:hypothetical protein VTN77DRAFT_4888 [Rasamsonia byssochlamydoides]|uniref:uncharacterized protein n=1 Tax=Rasamsonia byssochlamydoides TaxID=89139 RepID=UPI0037447400
MPTAIVTGATGILGREIVHALGRDPQTWTKVHALSRRQREAYPSNVLHDTIDLFAASVEKLAEQFRHGSQTLRDTIAAGGCEYIFFAAYVAKDDEGDADRVNGGMLQNFLAALALTGADRNLRRIILTTGAKQYGVHLGPVKLPMEEDDPWVEGPGRPPNFYYTQQRVLQGTTAKKKWDWVVTYPNDVIGVAKGNFMNLTTAIGLYAAVTKELNEPFIFPGSPSFYTGLDCFTYSPLHAQFVLWAALEPRAGNQAFNVVNGDVQSWQTLWPRLARRFGVTIPADQFSTKPQDDTVQQLLERPPLTDHASAMGIAHRVPRGEVRSHIDLAQWSQRPEVRQAWSRLAARENLQEDAFDKATWAFLNFVLGRNYDLIISMNKARRLGFQGWVDTWEALSEALDKLEAEGILPKSVVAAAEAQ